MELLITDGYSELSYLAAERVVALLAARPGAVVVPAVGTTPEGLYRELSRRHGTGAFPTEAMHVFQLDEYLGIPAGDDRSLCGWLRRSVLDPLEIPDDRFCRLQGDVPNVGDVCRHYDRRIDAVGGFDVAILGLGVNGHLGYNEPPADPDSRTHACALTHESVESASRYFGDAARVPEYGLTVGLGDLLRARTILLLVSGSEKREILRRSLEGPVRPEVPASYLRNAAHVTVICDRDAAGSLHCAN